MFVCRSVRFAMTVERFCSATGCAVAPSAHNITAWISLGSPRSYGMHSRNTGCAQPLLPFTFHFSHHVPTLTFFYAALTHSCVCRQQTPFHCPNCVFKRHNCFACGKLGDLGTDVFQCSHSKCAKFYHPHCLERQGVRVTKGTFIWYDLPHLPCVTLSMGGGRALPPLSALLSVRSVKVT
jgi:hypothetical protein